MNMPNRKYTVNSEYRYGFNGKEKSDEVHGEGNIYDYGFRIYNPRVAKFLSIDPLTKEYPWYTPYQFAGNKPIWAIDLDGAEEDISWQSATLDEQMMAAYGPKGIWDRAVDGLGNILFRLVEWGVTDNAEGKIVRNALTRSFGYTIPSILSNEDLGRNFQIVKENRDVTIKPDGGILNDLLSVLIGAVDMSVVLPGKGSGPAYFAIKASPIVARTISEVLTSLKIKKLTDNYKLLVDAATQKPIRDIEAEGAALLEHTTGSSLRAAKQGEAGDFIFNSGKYSGSSIDLMGMPSNQMKNFNMSEFKSSITKHFNKAVNYIGLDLRSFSAEQKTEVIKYISDNHSSQLNKLITIQ